MKKTLFLAFNAMLLVGCASNGIIDGVSQGKSVQMSYEQGFLDKDGTLSITMPDGELYSGKFEIS